MRYVCYSFIIIIVLPCVLISMRVRVSCLAECRCCGKAIDQILSREELVMKNYFNLLDF
jgi:hypothetical protein